MYSGRFASNGAQSAPMGMPTHCLYTLLRTYEMKISSLVFRWFIWPWPVCLATSPINHLISWPCKYVLCPDIRLQLSLAMCRTTTHRVQFCLLLACARTSSHGGRLWGYTIISTNWDTQMGFKQATYCPSPWFADLVWLPSIKQYEG